MLTETEAVRDSLHSDPPVVVVVYRYTLQASTFQMAILLQYNTEDSYTVQQLTDSTQIKTVSTNTLMIQLPVMSLLLAF